MHLEFVIDTHLVKEAQIIGHHKTPQDVIVAALKEYIHYHKQLQILTLFGTIDYDESYDYKEQRKRL